MIKKNRKLKEKKPIDPSEMKFETTVMKKETNVDEDYKKIVVFLVFIIIIGLAIGGLYVFNAKYVTKDNFQEEETTTTTTVAFSKYNINVNDVFKIDSKEYNVLFYDKKDDIQNQFYSSVSSRTYGDIPLYTVDMSIASNKPYYNKDGKENTNPSKYDEIVITRPTLIKFKKGKVVGYITSQEDILKTTKIN